MLQLAHLLRCLQEVLDFVRKDPYMTASLVVSYTVKPFQVLIEG